MRWDWLENIMLCLWLAAMLLLMVGCKTVQPVIMPNSHQQQHDSIRTEYKHDSVYIDRWHKEYVKGDTVYIHDSIWRDRWKFKEIHDSIYTNSTDTIYRTVEVTKPQSTFLRNSGIALWIVIALLVAGIVIGIILKIKK